MHHALSYFATAEEDDCAVHLTEIISIKDPRARSREMTQAKKDEIRGLLDRGTFSVLLREEIPQDANVLPGRFILAIKSAEDGKIKFKARYVSGGHRDRIKDLIVHSAATSQPQSIRILLAVAAMFGFTVWTTAVSQAYLQSAEPLSRELFFSKRAPEFELKPDQYLKLRKPLYGLRDSRDLWHRMLDNHHREDLGLTPPRSDLALYKIMSDNLLVGLSAGCVDDVIRAGTTEFREFSTATNRRF